MSIRCFEKSSISASSVNGYCGTFHKIPLHKLGLHALEILQFKDCKSLLFMLLSIYPTNSWRRFPDFGSVGGGREAGKLKLWLGPKIGGGFVGVGVVGILIRVRHFMFRDWQPEKKS